MHDIVIVGVPLLAMLTGIFFNNSQMETLESRLDGRIDSFESRANARFDRVDSRLDRVQADSSQFHTIRGKYEVRLEALEKRA